METKTLLYAVEGGTATVTLNRPERRNALTEAMLVELRAALETARADDAVRVVVLTGAGDRAFCAGADLAPPGGGGFLEGHQRRGIYAEVLRGLTALGKPTVARLNGHALAGGLGLVLACDLAVAAEDVELGTPEVHRGLMPYMVMAFLARHVGPKRALEIVLLGERLSAAQARDLGLVNRVVPRAELDTAVADLCARLQGKSAAVLRLGKEAFYRIADMSLDDALDFLRSQLTVNVLCEDAMEGVAAFLEKREPRWKHR
jgi:enoyl-CoA hydratase/carnithine racemase